MSEDATPVFDLVANTWKTAADVASSLRAPRDTSWLVDLAGLAGCAPGSLVLDAGGYAGQWGSLLDDRYGSQTLLCDIAPTAVGQAAEQGRQGVVADLSNAPFADARFDLVWCRDVLSMVDDPRRALTEFRRVLKPRGGLVLYAAFPTPRLEPLERHELFTALDVPDWWAGGADVVRKILSDLGFETIEDSQTSPEHTQANLKAGGDLIEDWSMLADLEREPGRFIDVIGETWYRKIRAWNRWSIYLLLGKLETVGWAARSPRNP